MRFLADGADIPDELIQSALTGNTTFLCGAGVSLRAGMPTFKGLTKYIYERLGETYTSEAPERDAFAAGEYDRALRSLEKRTHRPGNPVSRVREAAAARLAVPEGVSLNDHRALLELSKDAAGRSRLLTTNFDTLFERAIRNSGSPSHSGKAIPKPGGADDYGVLHLHGRIADPVLNLQGTDLILTSADFGDAYLRDGWASRYIEDRMRLGALVLVGYGAEDAAFRLLMETLDADRDRFQDMKDIYAIERATTESASFWRAKGIKPIEFAEYDQIYETLAEWARFAARPLEYARGRLTELLAKAPDSATEFDREQARFFLTLADLATTLAEINPSLAWLPVLAEWRLIGFDERRLVSWIERNLKEVRAIRDVVANIGMFGPEFADVLEYRLRAEESKLSSLLLRSWRLILRQLRSARRGFPRLEWFDLQPRLKGGDISAEVLERVAATLRPKVTIKKRFSLGEREEGDTTPLHPNALMSIEYTVDGDVNEAEVINSWPVTCSPEADIKFLEYLTRALDGALADAVDVGVEGEVGLSGSDYDVPSVASHLQNAHHSGFFEIVRVTADVWARLAQKDPVRALGFVERWKKSDFRLNRRLAAFACADPSVTANIAADVVLALPQGELFLTGSAVEVYRLLRARWSDWSPIQRKAIQVRLREGPPADWFREGAEIDRVVDRARFDLLGQLEKAGFELEEDSKSLLSEIRTRWPQWELRPTEQAGFSSWTSSSHGEIGDPGKLAGVPDSELVAKARALDEAAPFGEGATWQSLCQTDPDRALSGLEEEARRGVWSRSNWRDLLWARAKFKDPAAVIRVAEGLLSWPGATFGEIARDTSYWLNENDKALGNDDLWNIFDRIVNACSSEPEAEEEKEKEREVVDSALNAPAGRLAEILVRRLRKAGEGEEELPEELRQRLNTLVAAPGRFGKLARVRLAQELYLLFEVAPVWTAQRLLPHFEWSSPDAPAMWAARSYSRYIGSPELVRLTKSAFLELFDPARTPSKRLRVFAEWLTTIVLANQSESIGYPITGAEARVAFRRCGNVTLPSVANRLSVEMGNAPGDAKAKRWREVVGPVFQAIWPLDIELQTSSATFALTQLLRACGEAFSEAADVIVPFIRPDLEDRHATVFSLAEEPAEFYVLAPAKMIDVLVAVVGEARPASVYALRNALSKVEIAEPALAETRQFQRLLTYAAP